MNRVLVRAAYRPVIAAFAIMALAMTMPAGLEAQEARPGAPAAETESSDSERLARLRAAFILNFLKFTEFQNGRATLERVVCVACDEELGVVRDTLDGRQIGDGRAIKVMPARDRAVGCDVLYRCDRTPPRDEPPSVLVISSRNGICEARAHVLLFQEGSKMRFAVDVKHLARDQITMSSKALSLAKIAECSHD